MHEWMNEWLTEWMLEWKDELMDDWVVSRMHGMKGWDEWRDAESKAPTCCLVNTCEKATPVARTDLGQS